MIRLCAFIFSVFICFAMSLFASTDSDEYQFKGSHFVASYCDCDSKALAQVDTLQRAMLAAAEQSGATVLSEVHHIFPPSGLTMVILLSESHASIHTYPEHGACFVDLFTCGDNCSWEKFDAALRAYLRPKHVDRKAFARDEESHLPSRSTDAI